MCRSFALLFLMVSISVVIPTYNRLNFVVKTIESLLNQQSDDFELLIIDDGSTDKTEEFFASYKHPKVTYHRIVNSERGFARNYGASIAKGKYVNFFDSDDLAYNNHISTALHYIEKFDNPEIFHLNYVYQTLDGQELDVLKADSDNIGEMLIRKGNILSCNSVIIRKDIAERFPFCESRLLSGTEDYALWLALSSRFKIHYVPEITSVVIDHEQRSMASHDIIKMINRNMFLLDHLQSDQHFIQYVGKRFNQIQSECFSFIALHLMLEGKNRDGVYFLSKALMADWRFPFRRIRFMAIMKHMLKSFFRIPKNKVPETI